jgi:hypothetical protein
VLEASEVDEDARFVSDDPGVVAGRNDRDVTRPRLPCNVATVALLYAS